MQDFHKLKVWERSHEPTLEVYDATARYPQDERFALTSQTRRAMLITFLARLRSDPRPVTQNSEPTTP